MKRVWQAEQDMQIEEPAGMVPVVSQQSLVKAVVDGAIMLDRAGGTLSVVLVRHPTQMPGEMLTQAAFVEWKDRTDAKAQAEVADPFADGAPQTSVTTTAVAQVVEGPVEEEQAAEEVAPLVAGSGPIGDGLDDLEAEVDESAVPAGMR